jgi:hypothetical protein
MPHLSQTLTRSTRRAGARFLRRARAGVKAAARAPGTAMAVKTANLQPIRTQPFDFQQIASAQTAQKATSL